MTFAISLPSALLIASLAPLQGSDAPLNPVDPDFYDAQVRPILEKRCFDCHGGGKTKGGLDLSSRAGVERGGDLGPVVDRQQPDASLLLAAIAYEGPEMPPSGKLPPDEADVLRRWIATGAPMPEPDPNTAPIEPQKPTGLAVTPEHRAFWSFQPVRRPAVPSVSDRAWPRDPIDAFILDGLNQLKLEPAPPAEPVALVRRLSYDLTGLPPDPATVAAFVADPSDLAYERLVDELLASPAYGERWGRHWLDLVRFAETNSFERDSDKPFSWRYRDYVIESFNADKPYDQFVREQLAGDELDAPTRDSIIATGYYRLNAWDDEPTDRLQARYDELDDILTTTAQTFLGLTVNCARCHDHKIDPIPQRDYYRLMAFLHNLKPYSYNSEDVLTEIATADQREALVAADKANADDRRAALDALKPVEERLLEQIPEPRRSKIRGYTDVDRRRKALDSEAPQRLDTEALAKYSELVARYEAIPDAPLPPRALSARERGLEAPETFLLIRGSAAARGDKVEPGFPTVLGFDDPPLPSPDPNAQTSGRRRVLADWIASPANPLTARVLVNRIWQHHFGRGIVGTPSDYGLQGAAPTHPELLDYLASRLVDQGWSLKALQRQIVLSTSYRMSSQANAEAASTDPENDLFWRQNPRRLEAEEVRDSILAITGELNPKMHGPGVYPTIPPEYLAGQSVPGQGWGKSPPEEQRRRSVYIHVKRSLMTPILASFDAADTDSTCPVRFATTQPTQALNTLNGRFLNESARTFAARLRSEAPDGPRAQVARGLELVTGRPPSETEVRRGIDLLEKLSQEDEVAPDPALDLFALVLLNLNEFFYLD